MKIASGILIKSTPLLNNTLFENVTILITVYNKEGAIGVVVNQPFGRSLNELVEFSQAPYFPLYEGGPVDKEHLYFIHQRPDIIDDGEPIGKGVYFGGNFSQAMAAIKSKILDTDHIKIFVGYCGWDNGELEAELEEGSWEIISDGNEIIFE